MFAKYCMHSTHLQLAITLVPFFGKIKYTCFKRMIAPPESCSLLKSLNHPNANIWEVIEFVIRIIYNRRKSEKTLGDARYNMLFIKSKDKKKFASTRCLPPDEISLALKIKRDIYITISYTSCLNPIFVHHLQLTMDGKMTMDIYHQYGLKVLPYLQSANMHKMFQSHFLQMKILKL